MNRVKYFVISILLTAFAAISAVAQTQATRVVYINTDTFYDEKLGITRIVSAGKQIEREFAPRIKELQDGDTKLTGIAKEIENLSKLPAAQINQASITAKQQEGERLDRDQKRRKEDLEAAVVKRRQEVFGPISLEIGKAIDEFGSKNAYGSILDPAKLVGSGAVLFIAEPADVTKTFITFFNARPASPAAPK